METLAPLVKKFHASYANRNFTAVLARTRQRILAWDCSVQSTPSHLIYIRSIL